MKKKVLGSLLVLSATLIVTSSTKDAFATIKGNPKMNPSVKNFLTNSRFSRTSPLDTKGDNGENIPSILSNTPKYRYFMSSINKDLKKSSKSKIEKPVAIPKIIITDTSKGTSDKEKPIVKPKIKQASKEVTKPIITTSDSDSDSDIGDPKKEKLATLLKTGISKNYLGPKYKDFIEKRKKKVLRHPILVDSDLDNIGEKSLEEGAGIRTLSPIKKFSDVTTDEDNDPIIGDLRILLEQGVKENFLGKEHSLYIERRKTHNLRHPQLEQKLSTIHEKPKKKFEPRSSKK